MDLKLYIEDLLYRYECVIVPGFGAFLTHYKSAQVHSTTNAFYPPTKEVSFNVQLQSNDGLLASYISSVEKNPYEEVLHSIKKVVDQWHRILDSGQKITIKNIGVLRKNEEGKLQFQPSYHVNYLTDSFGLSSFVSHAVDRLEEKPVPVVTKTEVTRETLKEEVVALEEKTPIAITPERRNNRGLIRVAAAACLLIALGFTGYTSYNNYQGQVEVAQQEAEKEVNKEIQEATFGIPTDLEAIKLNLFKNGTPSKPQKAVNKENIAQHKFFVIAGAFRELENAERQVRILRRRDFDAVKVGKNRFGLHQVAYGSFSNRADANAFLAKIKATEAADAWLLTK
jgi:cell division septation protein DedD/nucleoid DNA-binding protein